MKPLERQFFRYVMRQINYALADTTSTSPIFVNNRFMGDLVKEYAEKHNCSEKQLWYYVIKWERLNILDYGTSIRTSWINLEKLHMMKDYYNIIPSRVIRKLYQVSNVNLF